MADAPFFSNSGSGGGSSSSVSGVADYINSSGGGAGSDRVSGSAVNKSAADINYISNRGSSDGAGSDTVSGVADSINSSSGAAVNKSAAASNNLSGNDSSGGGSSSVSGGADYINSGSGIAGSGSESGSANLISSESAIDDTKKRSVLELKGLRKSFGEQLVLDDISLKVIENEVVCVIGASGSGKSTLMRCINLLEPIDDGQIFLDGEDISNPRIKPDRARSQIGVVFQQFNLFPHMTVLDNVTLGMRKVFKVPNDEANQRGLELLEKIGIAEKAQVHPDRLSGGQQQRVAIVRAIATNPKLLLLDEVTSALDPRLVGEVLQLILELKSNNTTILMATHEMGFARRAADWIVFLHQGQLIAQDRPDQILSHPEHPALQEFLASEIKF
jgi:polar amino acid transport system ATP-binding protein